MSERLQSMGFAEHDIRRTFPDVIDDLNAAIDILLEERNRASALPTGVSASEPANPLHLDPTYQ